MWSLYWAQGHCVGLNQKIEKKAKAKNKTINDFWFAALHFERKF